MATLTSRTRSFFVLSWSHLRILQIWWLRTLLHGPHSPQLSFSSQPGQVPQRLRFFLSEPSLLRLRSRFDFGFGFEALLVLEPCDPFEPSQLSSMGRAMDEADGATDACGGGALCCAP